MKKSPPKQGAILLLDLPPTQGHEQRGQRPVVVLSPEAYNAASGLMLVCPVTTGIKGYPFEYALPKDLGISGVALLDQVRYMDWQARSLEHCGSVSKNWLKKASALIQLLLP